MKKSKILSMAAAAIATVVITMAFLFYIESFTSNVFTDGVGDSISLGGILSSIRPSIGASAEPSYSENVNFPNTKGDSDVEPLIDAYKVLVDGNIVGIVSSESEIEEIMNSLLDDYKNDNNVDNAVYEVTKDIQVRKVQTFSHNITDNNVVESALSDCVIFKVNAYELSIEGYHLGYYSTQQECMDILQSAKDKYVKRNMSDKNVVSVSFDREFDITEVYILSEDVNDTVPEDVAEKILADRTVEKRYTITTQEQFDELCSSKTVNLAREVALARIKTQGFVEVICEERMVNFVVKVGTSTVKTLRYSTTTKLNTSLLYTVKRTVVKGKNGSLTTNYEETYINGEYVSTEQVSQKKVNPVAEVIEYGTKLNLMTKITAKTGAGRFIWPTSGWITGLYGGSNSVVSYHNGIDIGTSRGTPIYAAAAGEIVEVGYKKDSWGYYVKIKHDSTYSTLYLHMNSYSVVVGQKVKQGDVIGYVGSTGIATGNHCHFSILKNGSYVNPITEMYGYAN